MSALEAIHSLGGLIAACVYKHYGRQIGDWALASRKVMVSSIQGVVSTEYMDEDGFQSLLALQDSNAIHQP